MASERHRASRVKSVSASGDRVEFRSAGCRRSQVGSISIHLQVAPRREVFGLLRHAIRGGGGVGAKGGLVREGVRPGVGAAGAQLQCLLQTRRIDFGRGVLQILVV